jgi:MFS family permease
MRTREQDEQPRAAIAGPPLGAPERVRFRTFSSLRIRDYRWLWTGYLFSFGAIMMQMVARGWLVYDLSASNFYLGLVMSMWAFAVLIFSPIGGVVADRMDKRNLLILTQAGVGMVSAVVAVLITLDMIALWHLLVASLVSGVIFSFNMPARQALIADLVGERELMNAFALSSAAMNLTRVAAPAVAGLLLEVIGVAGVYWVVVACYVFVIASILMIPARGGAQPRPGEQRRGIRQDMMEGLRYAFSSKALMGLLAVAFIAVLLGWNYQAFMPAVAVAVLGTGEAGFGILMAFSGIGAVVGTLAVATLGDFRRKGLLMTVSVIAMGVSLVLFSLSRNYYLSLGLIMLVGMTSMAFMTINSTLVQVITAPEMRGRVNSLLMMTWGLQPLGVLPFGVLADTVGVAFAIGLGGAALVLAVPLLLVPTRQMVRL